MNPIAAHFLIASVIIGICIALAFILPDTDPEA
jgi:hypothetical protein